MPIRFLLQWQGSKALDECLSFLLDAMAEVLPGSLADRLFQALACVIF
jgi:hypothetical protein